MFGPRFASVLLCLCLIHGLNAGEGASSSRAPFAGDEYRRLRMIAVEKADGKAIPEALRDAEPAQIAAYCYGLRKQIETSPDRVDEDVLQQASRMVHHLWETYPDQVDVLNLRLLYSLYPDLKREPYFELAYPIVVTLRQKEKRKAREEELVNTFCVWIVNMFDDYFLQTLNADKHGSGAFRRDYSLFDFSRATPGPQDVLMWKTLIVDHAQHSSLYAERWKKRAEAVREQASKIRGSMTATEAWERLGELVALSLSVRVATSRSPSEVQAMTREAVRQALARQHALRSQQKNPLDLAPDIVQQKRQLQMRIFTPVASWPPHRALVDFYLKNGLVLTEEHPVLGDYPEKDPIVLLARAYYLLRVRTAVADAGAGQKQPPAQTAAELLGEFLARQKNHPVANALMAQALLLQNQTARAKPYLDAAQKAAPELPETKAAEQLLGNVGD